MQRVYNFETDQSLQIIKPDYLTGEVNGLPGADALWPTSSPSPTTPRR
jgi:hypothetical protein